MLYNIPLWKKKVWNISNYKREQGKSWKAWKLERLKILESLEKLQKEKTNDKLWNNKNNNTKM